MSEVDMAEVRAVTLSLHDVVVVSVSLQREIMRLEAELCVSDALLYQAAGAGLVAASGEHRRRSELLRADIGYLEVAKRRVDAAM